VVRARGLGRQLAKRAQAVEDPEAPSHRREN
jgi:hypothetical protein